MIGEIISIGQMTKKAYVCKNGYPKPENTSCEVKPQFLQQRPGRRPVLGANQAILWKELEKDLTS
jgi:hypothetical protein